MQESHTNDPNSLHVEYLARVRALSQQVRSAISAIEQNNLKQLQASVAAQEMLCQEIAGTQWLPASAGEKKPPEPGQAALLNQIREACIALTKLNRMYAAVLKRSERSLGLMAAILRNYGQGYAKDSPGVIQHHTWSCEG
jgi:hypothetical protein